MTVSSPATRPPDGLPTTADLSDAHPEAQVMAPVFRHFGGRVAFGGQAVTLLVRENNPLVRAALQAPGQGRVLVVDGGGSLRCALLGDMLAQIAVGSGWEGVVIHGCVRDVAELRALDLGVLALAAHPRRSGKREEGEQDLPVTFADVTIHPGDQLWADEDGVVVLPVTLPTTSPTTLPGGLPR